MFKVITMKFKSFNIKTHLINALADMNYIDCTIVQEKVIPLALKRKNLLVQSATGTGKTHSFLIPVINNLSINKKSVQVLIISPTRELAKQTFDFANEFVKYIPNLEIRLLIGGKDRKKDESLANNQPHILIGTPGRLHDVLKIQNLVKLGDIDTIVLDEADMMMDMGYFQDIHEMIKDLKNDAHIMVFSATYPKKLECDLKRYITDEEIIKIGNGNASHTIKHIAIDRKHVPLNEATYDFIKHFNPYFILIFCSKKSDVIALYNFLNEKNIKVGIIHGDLQTRERKNMMKLIRENHFPVVVCSDMASRGIDLQDVTCVLNYDIPNNIEFYFHRAGRTGRLNKTGECYSFYNVDDIQQIEKLEKLGVCFSWMTLKNHVFDITSKAIKSKKRPKTEEQKKLDKEIKIATSKVKTKKIKPNYKKKVRLAAEKVKKTFRRQKIKENIKKQLMKLNKGE